MSKNIDATKLLIIDECLKQGVTNRNQIKYILATVQHETNRTFEPVKEAYWLSEGWRKRNLRYYPYYGRGFVQITWKSNYDKFGKLLNIDLVNHPELALVLENSVFILVYGMKHGTFTGKKLSDYITNKKVDFRRARRIINGLDKARKISKIAYSISIA